MAEEAIELRLEIQGDTIAAVEFGRFIETFARAIGHLLVEQLEPAHGRLDVGLRVESLRSGSIIGFLAIVCTSVVAIEDTRIAVINVIKRLARAVHVLLDYDLHEPSGDRITPSEGEAVHSSRRLLDQGGASQIEVRVYGDNVNVFVMNDQMAAALNAKQRGYASFTGREVGAEDVFIASDQISVQLERCAYHVWCARLGAELIPTANGEEFADRPVQNAAAVGRLHYVSARPHRFTIDEFTV